MRDLPRPMRLALWFLLAASVVGFLFTFVVESGFAARAVEVQPITRDSKSDTGWRLSGPPRRLIGIPSDAFVTQAAPGIPAQVDADRLRAAPGLVPADRAEGAISLARSGAALATLTLTLALIAFRRRPRGL